MMNSNETLDDIQWQTLIQQTAGFFSDLTIKRDFSITSKVVSTPASRQMRPVWSRLPWMERKPTVPSFTFAP